MSHYADLLCISKIKLFESKNSSSCVAKTVSPMDKLLRSTAVVSLLASLVGSAPKQTIQSCGGDTSWCMKTSVTRDTTSLVQQQFVLDMLALYVSYRVNRDVLEYILPLSKSFFLQTTLSLSPSIR